jgi:hypothetical protein
MTDRRESVVLPGILWGHGQEVACTVLVTKDSLLGSDAVGYCGYKIEQVSKALPEGIYQLSTNGEIIPMRYYHGDWFSASLS